MWSWVRFLNIVLYHYHLCSDYIILTRGCIYLDTLTIILSAGLNLEWKFQNGLPSGDNIFISGISSSSENLVIA